MGHVLATLVSSTGEVNHGMKEAEKRRLKKHEVMPLLKSATVRRSC
jgi:hypothetical protein